MINTISELQADKQTLAFYDEIKSTMGIAQVNLIWRHLATNPAVLKFAWHSLKSLYLNDMIPTAAWLFRESIALPVLAPLTDAESASLHEDIPDIGVIDDVLRTYERGNAQNLIALCLLRLLLTDRGAMKGNSELPVLSQFQKDRENADQRFGPIPPLPEKPALENTALENTAQNAGHSDKTNSNLNTALNTLSDIWVPERYRAMQPSVFRHLSYWPNFVYLIEDRLVSLEDATIGATGSSGAIDELASKAFTQANAYALKIYRPGNSLPKLDSDDQLWLENALDMFIHGMLSPGVVIVPAVRVLLARLPPSFRAQDDGCGGVG